MDHGLSTIDFPSATIFLQLKSYPNKYCQIMKTLPLHHFLKEILKKAKSSFIIKWFNR